MQSASVAFVDKLQQSTELNSAIRLIAEWNQNRYSTIESVTNLGTDEMNEFDNDMFPLTSIALPERPTRGILKAWASSRVDNVGADGFTSSGYEDTSNGARYTTASDTDKYKYWTSAQESASTSPFTISGVVPTVTYTNPTWANKVVVGLENSYASPVAFTISVTEDGINWTDVATDPTIQSNGRVEIYRQADDSWSTTVYRENPVQLRGVRLTVTEMNKGLVHFNLIELGARVESDLSYFIDDYSVTNSMSETSFAAPLGRASANTATVSLNNVDGRFTNDNTSSLYYNMLDKNVEFRLDLGINLGTMEAPDFEWIRQFTMRTETWNGQSRDGTDVELNDGANYLQSVNPNPCLYQDMTVGEIIWRLLDSVGFGSWEYNPASDDASSLVPQFWTDGTSSVWDTIAELAEATQTAVYFDELGVLKVMTRSAAFNLSNESVWTLDASQSGLKQPDIVSLDKTYDYEANVVNVSYRPTSISSESDSGVATMETVWEPEDTVTLRSSQIIQTFTNTQESFVITPSEAITWPYTGVVQIEGEFVRWVSKGYSYYETNGAWTSVYIKSDDEKVALDKKNPDLAYKNHFNGYFWCGIENRGLWNTVPATHSVDISGWTYNRYTSTNVGGSSTTPHAWNGGLIHNKDRSTVTLRTNKTFGPNTWYACTRGSRNDSPPYWYGTRLKFDTAGYTYGAAGIVMTAGDYDNGYYIELVRTAAITATDRVKWTNELCFYVKYNNGTIRRIGPNGGKGIPLEVIAGKWYDLDIHFEWQGSDRVVSIMVNGVTRMTCVVPVGLGTGESIGGRYGLFTRGFTSVEFEYIYASTYAVNDTFDDEGWFDRITGGYQSGQWDKEWVYGYRTNTKIKGGKKYYHYARYASRLMDEFGPIVHEVREYDVKFSKFPVLYSQPYVSNETQVICPEYNGNAFGATFILANTSRDNAIVSGEDTLMFGEDNSVDQKFLIYGRTFTQDDEKAVTVKDDQGTKRRGEIPLEIQSDWIQTEAHATDLGDWIVKHWSGGADEVEVESFGNPLLQLGDVVSVNYADKFMSAATHQYFVVKVEHSYDSGLETNLTLRRMKI